jgi:ribosomal protein S18 acetylase RimI-like enzyme
MKLETTVFQKNKMDIKGTQMNKEIVIVDKISLNDLVGFIEFSIPLFNSPLNFSPQLSENYTIRDYSQKLIDKAYILKAEYCNETIGLAAFYSNNFKSLESYLTYLFILPKMQGKSVGTTLVSSVINRVKMYGMKTLELNVDPNNYAAIKLYNKLNFNILDNYARNGHMTLRMGLDLTQNSLG